MKQRDGLMLLAAALLVSASALAQNRAPNATAADTGARQVIIKNYYYGGPYPAPYPVYPGFFGGVFFDFAFAVPFHRHFFFHRFPFFSRHRFFAGNFHGMTRGFGRTRGSGIMRGGGYRMR